MSDDLIRARALAHFMRVKLNDERQTLIARTGLSKGRITQLLKDGFGERAARSLEKKLHLPRHTLDTDPDGLPEPAPQAQAAIGVTTTQQPEVVVMDLQRQAAELVRAWLSLDEKDRNTFKRELEAKALQHHDPVLDGTKGIERYAAAAVRPAGKVKADTQ